MSSSNCCFLTCTQVSQEAGQVVWYSHLLQNFPQFIVIHTVKGFGVVNKAEIYVFLKLSCFFNDPVDVGNLFSGSSAFSKASLNICKFMVHVLLRPGLENFERYFNSSITYNNLSWRQRRWPLLYHHYYHLATLHAMWGLSPLTRGHICAAAVGTLSPNHWTGREFPPAVL